jgi:ABC-type branched-subunit amino acid transport system ATPase component
VATALLGRGLKRYQFVMWRRLDRLANLERRVQEVLRAIRLDDVADVEVRYLSYGHQRQVEIAVALASHPSLLLLDEPTAGLAQSDIPEMLRLLQGLPAGLTILIVEHNLELIFELVERVVVLHEGRIIMDGTPYAVRQDPEMRRLYFGTSTSERDRSKTSAALPRPDEHQG